MRGCSLLEQLRMESWRLDPIKQSILRVWELQVRGIVNIIRQCNKADRSQIYWVYCENASG